MSRPNTTVCGVCQSTFGESDCVHFSGVGTADEPYVPEPKISEAEGNLVECSPSGLGMFLPPIYQDPPACHIYATGDQTIPFDAAFILFFDDERYDTDNMHNEEAATSRIVFNTPGLYAVTLNVRWNKTNSSTATGDLAAFIYKNGSHVIAIDSFPVGGGDLFAMHSVTIEGAFEAGDFVEGMVKHDVIDDDEGLPMRILAERASPTFAAVYIRPIEGMDILGSGGTGTGTGGSGGTQYTLNGGQWWETPDHTSLDIAGDIDIRVAAAPTDWTPASWAFLSKGQLTPLGKRAYELQLPSDGKPILVNSSTGNDALFVASSAANGFTDGTTHCLRAVTDVDDGTGKYATTYYTKSTTAETALADCEDDSGWVQLGTVTPTAPNFTRNNTTSKLAVGAANVDATPQQFFTGDVYAMVLKNGINGTTVANPDFYHNNSPFTDSAGRTWTKAP